MTTLWPLTMWITANWKILKEMGLPAHLTGLLRNLYDSQEAAVRTGHETADWLKLGRNKTRLYIVVAVIQSLSHVRLFSTPWTTAHQASLPFTISRSWLKLMPIELVMPSNNLVFCHPLLLLLSIFPSIRVFSNESALHIRWPRYWSFSFSINPSVNIQD